MRTDGTLDGTYGPASMIGGPVSTYGGGNGLYTNICVVIDGLTALLPFPSNFSAFDFFACAEAYAPAWSALSLAVPPSGAPWPQLNAAAIPGGDQYTFGMRMPTTGNNDRCDIGHFSVSGLTIGLVAGEHTTWQTGRIEYCQYGVLASNPYGGSPAHAAIGNNLSCQNVGTPIAMFNSGYYGSIGAFELYVGAMDCENYNANTIVSDPGNILYGQARYDDLSAGGYQVNHLSGAANFKLLFSPQAIGPIGSPQAAPGSTVAQGNYYYRDATWYVSAATSISGITVDSTALGITAGAGAVVSFRVPAGHSWTPTYTGAMTVHAIVLE
jgi:hypothetical protein